MIDWIFTKYWQTIKSYGQSNLDTILFNCCLIDLLSNIPVSGLTGSLQFSMRLMTVIQTTLVESCTTINTMGTIVFWGNTMGTPFNSIFKSIDSQYFSLNIIWFTRSTRTSHYMFMLIKKYYLNLLSWQKENGIYIYMLCWLERTVYIYALLTFVKTLTRLLILD